MPNVPLAYVSVYQRMSDIFHTIAYARLVYDTQQCDRASKSPHDNHLWEGKENLELHVAVGQIQPIISHSCGLTQRISHSKSPAVCQTRCFHFSVATPLDCGWINELAVHAGRKFVEYDSVHVIKRSVYAKSENQTAPSTVNMQLYINFCHIKSEST